MCFAPQFNGIGLCLSFHVSLWPVKRGVGKAWTVTRGFLNAGRGRRFLHLLGPTPTLQESSRLAGWDNVPPAAATRPRPCEIGLINCCVQPAAILARLALRSRCGCCEGLLHRIELWGGGRMPLDVEAAMTTDESRDGTAAMDAEAVPDQNLVPHPPPSRRLSPPPASGRTPPTSLVPSPPATATALSLSTRSSPSRRADPYPSRCARDPVRDADLHHAHHHPPESWAGMARQASSPHGSGRQTRRYR
jgi:hypothetical protein